MVTKLRYRQRWCWMSSFSFFFFFFKSSGGWAKIKLKLPHFHVSDTLPLQQQVALSTGIYCKNSLMSKPRYIHTSKYVYIHIYMFNNSTAVNASPGLLWQRSLLRVAAVCFDRHSRQLSLSSLLVTCSFSPFKSKNGQCERSAR